MDTYRVYSQAHTPDERARLITARREAGVSLAAEPRHYRTTRRPFDPARYDAYLQMYGTVYGDMSDPVKRADTVKALRRRDALSLASACRALRAQVTATPTTDLLHELKVKTYQIEECGHVRPWNIRNADIHMYRMILNELTRRGMNTHKGWTIVQDRESGLLFIFRPDGTKYGQTQTDAAARIMRRRGIQEGN